MDRIELPAEGSADRSRRAAALRATVLIAFSGIAPALRGGVMPNRGRAALQALLLATAVLLWGFPGEDAGRAHASVVKALSLEQLTAKADEILVAVPTEQRPRRHVDGKLIVTDVSLQVQDVLKGSHKAGEIARATVLGGTLDGVALQVPGEASFAIGQRVLVFLQRAPRSKDLRVVGMSQGVLPLREEAGTTMVIPGAGGAALVDRGSDGQLQPAAAALSAPQPLTVLLERIRALVAAAR
jgi:hypothetical protein